jgi:membrane-bound serine protease (ClpP class)
VRPFTLIPTAFIALAATAFVVAQTAKPAAKATRATVTVLEIKGPIGPATSRYIERGIQAAQARDSRLIVLQMDTPGGLDTSMRDIIHAILASSVPIATYVSPPGSRAASAGTYILYASHIAAMAPATNVGAATPVSIGGEPEQDKPATKDKSASPKPEPHEPGTAMERKAVNDSVAYIRGLAELRGRNVEWAEQAVRGAASLSATDALGKNVIELIARDLPDLLAQLDGRAIKVGQRTVTLATRNATVTHVEPDWRTQLLSVITNPTIAYGLLLIGIYGLMLEGYNPGAILPGVIGAISLLLALFAFQILSVNYAGLALIAVGILMIVLEFFITSFGALGLGGLVAFVVGSIILLDNDIPGLDIAWPVIGGIATVGGLAVIGIAYLARRAMRKPIVTGVQGMVGETAEAIEDFTAHGRVRYGGELWNAQTSAPVKAGQSVRIVRVEGLLLRVEPLQAA